jgi:hypothetical protein
MRELPLEELQNCRNMRMYISEWADAYEMLNFDERDTVRPWLYIQKEQSDDFWYAVQLIQRGRNVTRESLDAAKATRIRDQWFPNIYGS